MLALRNYRLSPPLVISLLSSFLSGKRNWDTAFFAVREELIGASFYAALVVRFGKTTPIIFTL